jgi:hypothetical protein
MIIAVPAAVAYPSRSQRRLAAIARAVGSAADD